MKRRFAPSRRPPSSSSPSLPTQSNAVLDMGASSELQPRGSSYFVVATTLLLCVWILQWPDHYFWTPSISSGESIAILIAKSTGGHGSRPEHFILTEPLLPEAALKEASQSKKRKDKQKLFPSRNRTNSKVQRERRPIAPGNTSQPCIPTFYWRSKRSATATVTQLLKKDDDMGNGATVYELPLEQSCWAKRDNIPHTNMTEFPCTLAGIGATLDPCNDYSTKEDAQRIRQSYPTARFIYLVRNPIDRLISEWIVHYHKSQTASVKDPQLALEQFVQRVLNANSTTNPSEKLTPVEHEMLQQSMLGENLLDLLEVVRDADATVIIPVEAIASTRAVQYVMFGLCRFLQSPLKRVHPLHENKAPKALPVLSNATRMALQDYFRRDVTLLEYLVGYAMPWNTWVKHGRNVNTKTDWRSVQISLKARLTVARSFQQDTRLNIQE